MNTDTNGAETFYLSLRFCFQKNSYMGDELF